MTHQNRLADPSMSVPNPKKHATWAEVAGGLETIGKCVRGRHLLRRGRRRPSSVCGITQRVTPSATRAGQPDAPTVLKDASDDLAERNVSPRRRHELYGWGWPDSKGGQ
jgi:hypothetical protein